MYSFPILLPLINFFLFIIFSKIVNRNILIHISTIIIFLSTFLACLLIKDIVETSSTHEIFLFNWLHSGELISNWTIYVDFFTSLMIFIVNIISAFVQLYSIGYMKDDKLISRFFCYLNLFTFFMLMLVSSSNLLQLFFGWEGVGLCSYLLIGFWYYKISANNASLKAFLVNRIGDMFFVLGIILIYLTFDSINFNEIFSSFNELKSSKINFIFFDIETVTLICVLLFLGSMGKSAQIGLHTWLPDAMEGPTPVSALIHAATMVTAGVFLVCKMSIFFNSSVIASNLIVFIGSITAIFAAFVAITQNDIKRIIAYSTCSQLGFMFIAAGFSMYNLAMFHLLTHAFFKALLFLGAGSVINAMNHEQNIKKMGKLWKKIPITYVTMIIGSLALAGIPFFSGFYSKELIVNSGLASNLFLAKYVYIISIVVVFLTSIYSFRLIFWVFHGQINFPKFKYLKIKEPTVYILLPIIILSIFAIFSGYLFKDLFISEEYERLWISSNIANLSNYDFYHHHSITNLIPTFFAFIGVFSIIYFYFFSPNFLSYIKKRFSFFYKLILNKFYFDEIYNKILVKQIIKLSQNLWKKIDEELIDRLGPNALAMSTKKLSNFFSNLQSGYLYHYALSFILGMTILISFLIFFI